MPSAAPFYADLVASLISELESGVMPWRKPWVVRPPANLFTRKPYGGVNRLLLSSIAADRGYASNFWMTERQICRRGGRLAPGVQRPVYAFAMRWYLRPGSGRDGKPERQWRLGGRSFELYNFEQTRGLGRLLPEDENLDLWMPVAAERIVLAWKDGPPREVDPQRAFYSPSRDAIGIPPRETFANQDEYYSTLFHEMVHATGHASRCARWNFPGCDSSFGSEDYAFEELVAEIGAMLLCGEAGIANRSIQNNAAYIAGWLRTLRDDRRRLFVAVHDAGKACDWILGRRPEPEDGSGSPDGAGKTEAKDREGPGEATAAP